jgi:hypothetical protein
MQNRSVGHPRGWQIDRNVPVAILIGLAIQTSSAVWYASKLDSRVAALEAKQSSNDSLTERLTRVETKLDFIIDKRAR